MRYEILANLLSSFKERASPNEPKSCFYRRYASQAYKELGHAMPCVLLCD
jgi:hypothetical protein